MAQPMGWTMVGQQCLGLGLGKAHIWGGERVDIDPLRGSQASVTPERLEGKLCRDEPSCSLGGAVGKPES